MKGVDMRKEAVLWPLVTYHNDKNNNKGGSIWAIIFFWIERGNWRETVEVNSRQKGDKRCWPWAWGWKILISERREERGERREGERERERERERDRDRDGRGRALWSRTKSLILPKHSTQTIQLFILLLFKLFSPENLSLSLSLSLLL